METSSAIIEILLATYNGERFIAEQLDSIFRQTYPHFRIIVRDDGSSDKTKDILKTYAANYPPKIQVLEDDGKNAGATQNFARLLQYSNADYVAFCDQDDVWLPDKLEISLQKLQKLEQGNHNRPCLVYSDMKLIDEAGQVLQDSVWKQLQLDPKHFKFNRLLIQNIPHGCTMMFNRAMKELVSPIPPAAMLHDHWMAIIASLLGAHAAIMEPLVLLRNHDQNVTRKKTTWMQKADRYLENILSDDAYEQMVRVRVGQAKAIRDRYGKQLSSAQSHTLDEFIALEDSRGMKRKWKYLKNGFFRTTFRHTLKMILRG
jgi:glycosyltransferase involved in cell wall biosynthesis